MSEFKRALGAASKTMQINDTIRNLINLLVQAKKSLKIYADEDLLWLLNSKELAGAISTAAYSKKGVKIQIITGPIVFLYEKEFPANLSSLISGCIELYVTEKRYIDDRFYILDDGEMEIWNPSGMLWVLSERNVSPVYRKLMEEKLPAYLEIFDAKLKESKMSQKPYADFILIEKEKDVEGIKRIFGEFALDFELSRKDIENYLEYWWTLKKQEGPTFAEIVEECKMRG